MSNEINLLAETYLRASLNDSPKKPLLQTDDEVKLVIKLIMYSRDGLQKIKPNSHVFLQQSIVAKLSALLG